MNPPRMRDSQEIPVAPVGPISEPPYSPSRTARHTAALVAHGGQVAMLRTRLATLHAFQGWADQFLLTPDAGIVDIYGSLGYARYGWRFEGIFHHFSAEDGGGSYGRELDFSATRPLRGRYTLMLKSAIFDGDSPVFPSTTKAWLMITAAC